MSRYIVTEADLIMTLEGFPLEVAQWMVDEQVRQGNQADISVFQKNRCASISYGGIEWEDCEIFEDQEYSEIILLKNFKIFFDKLPKQDPKQDQISDPIVDSVVEKYKSRSILGIEKYGMTLESNKGGVLEFLVHLQEELMDATLYIEKLKKEIEKLK